MEKVTGLSQERLEQLKLSAMEKAGATKESKVENWYAGRFLKIEDKKEAIQAALMTVGCLERDIEVIEAEIEKGPSEEDLWNIKKLANVKILQLTEGKDYHASNRGTHRFGEVD